MGQANSGDVHGFKNIVDNFDMREKEHLAYFYECYIKSISDSMAVRESLKVNSSISKRY